MSITSFVLLVSRDDFIILACWYWLNYNTVRLPRPRERGKIGKDGRLKIAHNSLYFIGCCFSLIQSTIRSVLTSRATTLQFSPPPQSVHRREICGNVVNISWRQYDQLLPASFSPLPKREGRVVIFTEFAAKKMWLTQRLIVLLLLVSICISHPVQPSFWLDLCYTVLAT